MPTARAVVTISNAGLGGTGTNTFHLRSSGPIPGTEADFDNLMADVQAFYSTIGVNMPGGTTVAFNGEYFGVGESENEYWQGTPWSGSFNAQGSMLPPANAVCVNWRGQSGDRSRRGRTFVGPIQRDAAEVNGTIAAGSLGQFRAAAAALVTASEGFDNGALGVWSRQEQVFRDWVSSSVQDQFAVLRSRRD